MAENKRNKLKIPVSESVSEEQDDRNLIEEVAKTKSSKSKQKKEIKEKSDKNENGQKKNDGPGKFLVFLKNTRVFIQNPRTQNIIGLLFLFSAVYLAVSFTSFLFTWEVDQDKLAAPSDLFFSNEIKVQNWFGKLGALISHLFMFKWFGVPSFFLVPVLFILGLKKLLNRPFPFAFSVNSKLIFLMFWTSVLLGFIFNTSFLFLGGGFGYIINQELTNLIGVVGVLATLGLSFMIFLVIAFNFNFQSKPREIVPEPLLSDLEDKKPVFSEVIAEQEAEENLTKEEEEKLLDITLKTEEENPIEPYQNEPRETLEINNESIDLTVNETPAIRKNDSGDNLVLEVENAGKEEKLIEDDGNIARKLVEEFGEYDPTLDLGNFQMPHLDLLNNYGNIETKINQEELNTNKDRILNTLKNYGIEIDRIKATIGPTVTLYEIVPAAGVRISKIKNLEDDIALSLSALGIRIIAPIPGKGTIGIEVPNQTPEMVPMRNILASEKFQNSSFDLPIALGKTISNETFIADLSKMPHLLMAGATGQGKSVGLNAILVSLLYKKHPAQLKFVLVDPKKVELSLYNKIERHYLAKLPNSEDAIITDTTKVIHTLNSLCIEMDNRYELLKDAQVKNLKEYNTKFVARKLNPNDGHKYLPYIVLVIDEFADLIMTAGKEVETPIARLAQLARAIGIHLIIATQRPSVNIITGVIKANFPARIAFRVTSKIDSRTILDTGGAEQLIGRGDMLLSTGNDLTRIQCAFVDTPEVEEIADFIGGQRAYPSAFMLPEYIDENADDKSDIDLSERDKMFDEAARIVVQHQQGSASLLQRKLKLGYNRAGRLVDQLEAAGIVGPFEGSKAREVLVKDLMHLDDILRTLNQKDS